MESCFPRREHRHRFAVEGDVPGLLGLGVRSAHREHGPSQVDVARDSASSSPRRMPVLSASSTIGVKWSV